jgi:hypothetical protein
MFKKKKVIETLTRVVGINKVKFVVSQDYNTTRKNIVLMYEEFETIFKNLNIDNTDTYKVQNIYELYINDLKDVKTIIVGYY